MNYWRWAIALYICVLLLVAACGGGGSSSGTAGGGGGQNNAELEQYLKRGINSRISQDGYRQELFASAASPDASANVSDRTNTQEAGVDEADIVEVDGNRIYIAKRDNERDAPYTKIDILSSNPQTAETTLMGSINLQPTSDFTSNWGMYLRKTENISRLALLESNKFHSWDGPFLAMDVWIPFYNAPNHTVLNIVDASVPDSMAVTQRWEIDGMLVSSRRIENHLYLVTRYSPDLESFGIELYPETEAEKSKNKELVDELQLRQLLPKYRDRQGNEMPLIVASDCVVPDQDISESYYEGTLVVISSIDLDNPSTIKSKCLAASISDLYASTEALHLIGSNHQSTVIHKYSLKGANAEYRGQGSVPGSIPCQPKSYCFGEQNGVLRVLYSIYSAALEWPRVTYHLDLIKESDSNDLVLDTISSLPNEERPDAIGKPGELVYSMRSYKDYAYIVTFEKVDPLYVVDLSDPTDPFIAGELEVTGFSEYLHPIGDNYLLGIGKDAIYEEARDITWYQGIKVELFDVSDPVQPASIAHEIIGKRGSNSPVLSNPLAFSSIKIDDNHTRISIPVYVASRLPEGGDPDKLNQHYDWQHTGLYVFDVGFNAVTQSHLTQLGKIIAGEYVEDINNLIYTDLQRGIFHGQVVHYLYSNHILSRVLSNKE